MNRSCSLPLFVAVLLALTVVSACRDAAAQRHYVCPACDQPCDDVVYDEPGTCPKCGMTLVDQDSARARRPARPRVAILIFDGVQIIDYTGPYEIFQAAGFDVYTVAESTKPVVTTARMTVIPRFALAEAPQPDVLVVPGGGIGAPLASAVTLAWVKQTTAAARHTLSVCNGAFILAKAGLLDGLTATTTNGNVSKLRVEYPRVRVVDDQRFVDNGKVITAGGLTAGIDGALHVVERVLGRGAAQAVALAEEYDWRPTGGFVRGKLADTNLASLWGAGIEKDGTWEITTTEGGVDRWDLEGRGTSRLTASELMDRIVRAVSVEGKWTAVKTLAPVSSREPTTSWRFTGRDGRAWTGTISVYSRSGAPGDLGFKVAIARSG